MDFDLIFDPKELEDKIGFFVPKDAAGVISTELAFMVGVAEIIVFSGTTVFGTSLG